MPRKRKSVLVNTALLRQDVKDAGLTQEEFAAKIGDRGGDYDRSKVQRVLNGERVMPFTLEQIAAGLDVPVERYRIDEKKHHLESDHHNDISGRWDGFFVEPDNHKQPSLVRSSWVIAQDEGLAWIDMTDTEESGHQRREVSVEATVVKNVLIVKSRVSGWALPYGIGLQLLKATHSDMQLQGRAIWYDLDTNNIEHSPIIFVRKEADYREQLLEDAERLMQAHKKSTSYQ